MAGYREHLIGGALTSAFFTIGAFLSGIIELMSTPYIFFLGTIGGLLPDLDSDTGRPVHLLKEFLCLIVPVAVAASFKKSGFGAGLIILMSIISYLVVRFILLWLFTRVTVHRGIMHSIPFALCCGFGGIIFGRFLENKDSLYAGIAVFLGCMTHLVMDELNSFSLKFGFLPVPNRFVGTALKIKSNSRLANLVCYLTLLISIVSFF